MENQEQNEVVETKPSPLHTVTPLSRYIAMGLFVILPFLSGWIGYTYAPEKIVEVEKVVEVEKDITIAVTIETIKTNAVQLEALLQKESPDATDMALFQTLAADSIAKGEDLIAQEPDNPDVWAAIGNIYSIGVQAGIEGSYEKAFEYLSKATRLNPQSAEYYLHLAKLEARNGDYIAAESIIETALALDRNNPEILFVASDIAVTLDKYYEAIDLINELITIEPDNPLRYLQLGTLEASRGNTAEAIAAWEVAATLEPNNANTRFRLGYLYYTVGRLVEAEREIQAVIDMNKENVQAEELLKEIQEAQ